MNTITHKQQVDEFGRDISLKPKPLYTSTFLTKFSGKSWAQMNWDIEDEEEQVTIALDALRKAQWLKGEYLLEEGEIFE